MKYFRSNCKKKSIKANYLFQSSFSEISAKNKKKTSGEPWWATKDSGKIGSSMNTTKSFLKQSTKSKLTTQHESDEHFDTSKKKPATFEEKYSIYDESFEQGLFLFKNYQIKLLEN